MSKHLSRFQAAGIHLAISAMVALAFLALVFYVWYPQPYFDIGGGGHLLIVLIAVDVTIGPLLTLIVFKAGKPGLKRDLAIIAALQITALILGAGVITNARPIYVVWSSDRFVVISPTDITDAAWQRASASRYPGPTWTGPELVSVPMPADPQERNKLMFEVLSGNTDLPLEPRLYVPYAEDAESVRARLRDLAEFGASPPAALAEALAGQRLEPAEVGWVPLVGRTRSAVMLIGRNDMLPRVLVDVDPWEYVHKAPKKAQKP
ncbi:MAG: hypothetical protein H6980_04740 [Gammaproteobacteria bacterium]|nr:hypothetical protein [Gammaproteobacteria bacterium]